MVKTNMMLASCSIVSRCLYPRLTVCLFVYFVQEQTHTALYEPRRIRHNSWLKTIATLYMLPFVKVACKQSSKLQRML